MSGFERGFKAWSERASLSLRRELKILPHDAMPLDQLAAYLGVQLLTPDQIDGLPESARTQLLDIDPDGWSAVTCLVVGKQTIIYNPAHSPQRQSSDIAHELAHVVLGHEPSQIVVSQNGEMCMRSFNTREEAEANWLAGAILIPREALLSTHQNGLSEEEICSKYRISKKMLSWRLTATGVAIQAKRAGRYKS